MGREEDSLGLSKLTGEQDHGSTVRKLGQCTFQHQREQRRWWWYGGDGEQR